MSKKERTAEDVIKEARQAADAYETGYWPEDGDLDNVDQAPIASADGSPRRYWVVEKGATLFGYYLGCEVTMMPKFGKPDEQEERAFFLLEVAPPPGYRAEEHGGKAYAVKVKRPRSTAPEFAVAGDVVYVGVRARLQPLVLFSSCDFQPLIGVKASTLDKTARGFNLWGFDWRAWKSDRPALRVLAAQDSLSAMFGAQDRGLYAARELFGLVIPEKFQEAADRQALGSGGGERRQIAARNEAADDAGQQA